MLDHVTGPLPDVIESRATQPAGDVVTFGEAIRLTLHELMERDERIRVFGEDVADAPTDEALDDVPGKGGVFGITHGLQREFGQARCFNSPLAEANIVGRAVGRAIRGLASVLRRSSSSTTSGRPCSRSARRPRRCAGDRTASGRCRWCCASRSAGTCRAARSGTRSRGESIFTHTPGLLVVFPSRARDAAGLLRTAFECEDPVLFLEHKHLYRQMYNRDPFPPPDYKIPFGKGAYVTRGDDITLVTYGATVQRSVQAARELEKSRGLSVEIIDLRSLAALGQGDRRRVGEEDVAAAGRPRGHRGLRLRRRGRRRGSTENCFFDLDAPVMRVGAKFSFVAYEPTLEDAILPQTSDIADALQRLASV